jgi:hypothetical protein
MRGAGIGIGLGGGSNAVTAPRAANRLVALVGNSLSEQIYSQTGSQDCRAYGSWINILSFGRMRVERDLVFARSGQTSAMLEEQFAAAAASRAGTVVVNPTTNDCRTAAGTLAEVRARYLGWKQRLRAAGKLQIWCDGQPRADSPGGDYAPERNALLRDMVRAEMDDPASGCIVAPTFAALGSYPGSVQPAEGMLRPDDLHSSYAGAHAAAREIVAVAQCLMPPFDPLTRTGIVAPIDTGFTGGGANVAPASGGAFGGIWSISATAGISWQMIDDERGVRWIEFDVPGIDNASIVLTGPAHAGLVGAGRTFVPGVTRIEASVLWRIAAGHAHARMARCYLYDSGGQTLPYDMPGAAAAAGAQTGAAIDSTDEGSAGAMSLPPGGIAGLLNPWAGTLRASANRVMPLIAWYGVSGQPARARIGFAMPQIRIV